MNVLGGLKQIGGTFAGGFLPFTLAGLGCAFAMARVGQQWEGAFVGRGGLAAAPALEPAATPPEPILKDDTVVIGVRTALDTLSASASNRLPKVALRVLLRALGVA